MPKNLPWSLVGGVDIRTSGCLQPLRSGYATQEGVYVCTPPNRATVQMFLDCIVHHFFIVAVDDGEAVGIFTSRPIAANDSL